MTDHEKPEIPVSPESSSGEVRYTSCDALHQYNGGTYCGSDCTLQSPHGPAPHVCGHGHSF